jgi:hypothetical protein
MKAQEPGNKTQENTIRNKTHETPLSLVPRTLSLVSLPIASCDLLNIKNKAPTVSPGPVIENRFIIT